MFKNLFVTILIGLIIGLSTAIYIIGLEYIQMLQSSYHSYPYLLLPVFGLIILFKRNTLFFPTKLSQVVDATELEQKYWSRTTVPANFLGSWLSHLAGASLGREGTIMVIAAGLSQPCGLNWNYYRSIVISAAFACVVGQPWIAVIFMLELFNSQTEQKVFSVIMAWIGVLVLQTLGIEPFFSPVQVDFSGSFATKLLVVLLVGVTVGLISQYYKRAYLYLSGYFAQKKLIAGTAVGLLMVLFLLPELKPFHSLGLASFPEIQNGQADILFVTGKIVFTLLFVSLGFIGGEFVPAILVGSSIGVLFSNYFNLHPSFGLVMGLLAFFTGVSRLKWTSLCLIFLWAGGSAMLWAYVCLSVTRYCSGNISIYRKLIAKI